MFQKIPHQLNDSVSFSGFHLMEKVDAVINSMQIATPLGDSAALVCSRPVLLICLQRHHRWTFRSSLH
jgi:hypothetical protein